MKKLFLEAALLAVAISLGACATAPTDTALLDHTRSEYLAAQSNPKVATYASHEMKEAKEAYAQANAASDHGDSAEKVDRLASAAMQKIMYAQKIAKQKSTEEDFATTPQHAGNTRMQ
jgi:hypothetical protein